MAIDIETISRQRHTCLIVLRMAAVALVLTGALVAGLNFQSRIGRFTGFDYVGVPVLAILATFWAPAAVLAFGGRGIARWIVPVPSPVGTCPQCGYSLKNLKSPICPECGLSLRAPGG